MDLPPKKNRKITIERPPNIPDVVWTTMTPEARATVNAALQQNKEEVTKQVTKQVTEKMREELKLSNLIMQLRGPEADSAKALLKAATLDTHLIGDITQRLKELETQIQDLSLIHI